MSRFFAVVRLVFLGGLVVVVGTYLVVNLAGLVGAAHKRSVVRADLTARLATAVPAARTHQADVRAAAADLGVPAVSWIAQECDFPTSDAGWMVQSYRQSCRLTALTAWRMDSQTAAQAAARRLPESIVGPPPAEGDYVGTDCIILARGTRGEARNVEVVLVPQRGNATYWCGDRFRPGYYHRMVEGAGESLEPTAVWLVVHSSEDLTQVTLGCSHWSVLFCGNPFGDKPAYGDPPAA